MTTHVKPLVSYVILTYKQEEYIAQCIQGALSQTYENMEVIISDDCSPDETWKVIQETVKNYKGSKKIVINRNEKNMGLVPHFNHVMFDIAKGVILSGDGGDDFSNPNRVEKMVEELLNDRSIVCVSGQMDDIDKYGNVIAKNRTGRKIYKLDDEYIRSFSFMAGGACKDCWRTVLDVFGPLDESTPTEDSTMRFRCLLMGNILQTEDVILNYRHLETSLSSPKNRYKLKTDAIVAQYEKDIQTALNKNLINDEVASRLRKKIHLYKLDRNMAEYKSNKPRLVRGFVKVLQNINAKRLSHI